MNISQDEKIDEEPDLEESASSDKSNIEEVNADSESNKDVNKNF
jgi:hypothetical protein